MLTRHHKEREMGVTANAISLFFFSFLFPPKLWLWSDSKMELKCFIVVMVGLNTTWINKQNVYTLNTNFVLYSSEQCCHQVLSFQALFICREQLSLMLPYYLVCIAICFINVPTEMNGPTWGSVYQWLQEFYGQVNAEALPFLTKKRAWCKG